MKDKKNRKDRKIVDSTKEKVVKRKKQKTKTKKTKKYKRKKQETLKVTPSNQPRKVFRFNL